MLDDFCVNMNRRRNDLRVNLRTQTEQGREFLLGGETLFEHIDLRVARDEIFAKLLDFGLVGAQPLADGLSERLLSAKNFALAIRSLTRINNTIVGPPTTQVTNLFGHERDDAET